MNHSARVQEESQRIPHNADAERDVLGALIVESGNIDRVARIISPDDFYSERNKLIAMTIWTMRMGGDQVDLPAVCNRLKSDGKLDAAGGVGYVQDLVGAYSGTTSAEYHARLISEKAYRREIYLKHDELVSACMNGSDPAEVIAAMARIPRPGGNVDRIVRSIMSHAELVEAELPETQPILGNSLIARRDWAVLAGRKGLGKTWLALQLAAAVAEGEPWLAWPTVRCRTLVYSLEMSRDRLRARLEAIAPGRKFEDLYLFGRDSLGGGAPGGPSPIPKLARPEDQAMFRGVIEEIEPEFVIVDPIGPSIEADELKELPAIAGFFTDLVARTGCSLLATHHPRKSPPGGGNDDDLHGIRGASQFTDWVCSAMVVKVERGNYVLRQACEPRHCQPQPDVWLARMPGGAFEMCDAPMDQSEQANLRASRIAEELARNPAGISVDEAMRASGLKSKSATIAHLKGLGAVRIGGGRASIWKNSDRSATNRPNE